MTLRTRLLLALLGLVAAGLVVSSVITFTSLRSFLLERIDQQLNDARVPMALTLADNAQLPVPGGPGMGPRLQPSLPPGTYGELRDPSGQVLARITFTYQSQAGPAPALPNPLPAVGSAGQTVFDTGAQKGSSVRFRVLVATFSRTGGTEIIAIPLTETSQTLNRLLGIELLVSLGVLAALAAAAWLIVKRDLRPLEHMAATAGEIAAGDLSQRVEPAEPRTEVGRLGLSLNIMLARIEEAFAERMASEEKLRRFLADASHELRTPLTSIRGYAEVFERGAKDDPEDLATAMRRIEEESKRMGVLVNELLMLARLGEGREPAREPVDLVRVVTDGVSDARAAAPERAIDLTAPETVVAVGDEDQLRQVVANLLGNALRHTPATTPVHVRLAAEAGYAVLEVADEGPGLPPEARARVFEPFYRADPSRARLTGGAGLGLAIVAAIATAHGGDATVSSDGAGPGAAFTVRVPLAGAQV